MAITLTTASAKAMLDALVDRLDVSAAARCRFYTTADTLVANLEFQDPAFKAATAYAASSCRVYMNTTAAVTDASADNAGTITKWTMTTENGTVIFRGTATNTGGGGDITFTSTAIGAGEAVTLTAFYVALKLAG